MSKNVRVLTEEELEILQDEETLDGIEYSKVSPKIIISTSRWYIVTDTLYQSVNKTSYIVVRSPFTTGDNWDADSRPTEVWVPSTEYIQNLLAWNKNFRAETYSKPLNDNE